MGTMATGLKSTLVKKPTAHAAFTIAVRTRIWSVSTYGSNRKSATSGISLLPSAESVMKRITEQELTTTGLS